MDHHPQDAIDQFAEPKPSPASDADLWLRAVIDRLRTLGDGRSYRDIGRRTGTHPETVRRYLSGSPPCARFIAAMCVAFDASADWVLTGRTPATPSLSPPHTPPTPTPLAPADDRPIRPHARAAASPAAGTARAMPSARPLR